MDKFEYSFVYKTLDMILVVEDFTVDIDDDVEILEFSIELDYQVAKEHPHPLDEFAKMVKAMLKDGQHLEDVIMYAMEGNDVEKIREALREEWGRYWWDYECGRADYLMYQAKDRRL